MERIPSKAPSKQGAKFVSVETALEAQSQPDLEAPRALRRPSSSMLHEGYIRIQSEDRLT